MSYVVTHRPCPACSRPLTVDPDFDSYVCLNKLCPWWHTYVAERITLGKLFDDHWSAFPRGWETRNIWPAVT